MGSPMFLCKSCNTVAVLEEGALCVVCSRKKYNEDACFPNVCDENDCHGFDCDLEKCSCECHYVAEQRSEDDEKE